MNLTEFDKDLAKEFGLTNIQARRILSFINKLIRAKLLFGAEVSLRKLGTFKLRIRKARNYKNLQTGKTSRSKRHYFLDLFVSPSMKEDLKKKTVW